MQHKKAAGTTIQLGIKLVLEALINMAETSNCCISACELLFLNQVVKPFLYNVEVRDEFSLRRI